MNQTYNYLTDPGHGWLQVPHEHIAALNITGISGYSYKDKSFAYLEEDCDMALFVDKATSNGWTITFRLQNTKFGDSFVRSLRRYE